MSLQGSSSKKAALESSQPAQRQRDFGIIAEMQSHFPFARRNNYETLAARKNLNVRFYFLLSDDQSQTAFPLEIMGLILALSKTEVLQAEVQCKMNHRDGQLLVSSLSLSLSLKQV